MKDQPYYSVTLNAEDWDKIYKILSEAYNKMPIYEQDHFQTILYEISEQTDYGYEVNIQEGFFQKKLLTNEKKPDTIKKANRTTKPTTKKNIPR